MEPSVLERQRAVLQRIYHQPQHDHHLHHHSYSVVSDCDHSSITRSLPIPNHADWQCNSSFSNNPKKRKAEIDIEDKGVEAEEAAEEKSEITTKTERETSANTCSKVSEVQKPDYIHVRARRGQATDSHSLAERARREKISKKMKCLQDLVPGCNKVTGKAGMLDEIINYVQSLQKQVEFLSMKLAAINPRLDFSIDNIFAKEIPAYIASLQEAQFEATNSTCFQYNDHVAIDQSQILLQKAATSSLPIPEVVLDSSSISQLQQLLGWESDWQSLFTAGFH